MISKLQNPKPHNCDLIVEPNVAVHVVVMLGRKRKTGCAGPIPPGTNSQPFGDIFLDLRAARKKSCIFLVQDQRIGGFF